MKMPPRPAELDRLDSWVGNWNSNFEMCSGGKTMTMTGTGVISWDCEKRILFERATSDMGEMGKVCELILYSWDCDAGRYKVGYFSGMGEANMGHMKWNEKKGAFELRGKGKNPMTHQTTIFEMDIRMPDQNTMTFKATEWDALHLTKLSEGTGTAKRA